MSGFCEAVMDEHSPTMECIVFVGIQGSGKSAFFKERFADTHLRINLDMLKTRHREAAFFQLCLESGMRCVIDNTNPTAKDRANYITLAKARGFDVTGYWFDVPVKDALGRNHARADGHKIPVPGLLRTAKILEPPAHAEGFDRLFRVQLQNGNFLVEPLTETTSSRE
jgi:predicted kinase